MEGELRGIPVIEKESPVGTETGVKILEFCVPGVPIEKREQMRGYLLGIFKAYGLHEKRFPSDLVVQTAAALREVINTKPIGPENPQLIQDPKGFLEILALLRQLAV